LSPWFLREKLILAICGCIQLVVHEGEESRKEQKRKKTEKRERERRKEKGDQLQTRTPLQKKEEVGMNITSCCRFFIHNIRGNTYEHWLSSPRW